MYPISNALKEAFESNAKQYARITVGNTVIDNSRIRLGSFSVNRYALAEDTVVFGSCVAAEFNVTLENGDGAFSTGTFLGQEAFVEVGCDINGTVTYVPHGYFTYDMVTAQASALKLSALDRMMKFEKVVNPTPYSVSGTVSSLIDTVCTACGVPRGTFTLPVNGTLALSGELTDVKTYRDILRWIGEVTGTIAYIGYDGKLYFGWYSGTEDFSVDPTNRAQGSISDDATTITSVSIVQGENMVTAGTGAKIVIRDNALIPLASATAQAIANNLYNHVNGFTYRTFEAGVHPMPHIAPLDCGVYSDLDGNDYSVCCTDWTFTLNANTKIAGKGGKQAYGRGYTLDESVFTARNIAAGAVTAEKISVEDLAALRATIAGWNIGAEALYKEVTSGGYTYRVELCAPASITPNTQCITVKRKATGSDTWEIIDTTTYGGQHTAKDFIANGRVLIAPDYDLQEAGVYAIDLVDRNTGEEIKMNPQFIDIGGVGFNGHIDANHVRVSDEDALYRAELEAYGQGYTVARVAEGTVNTAGYNEVDVKPNAISYRGRYAEYNMIKFKDGVDQWGNGIVIGGGGLTVVGGGEAADTIASSRSGGTEELHLAADGAVAIWSKVSNGEASAKKFLFDTSGDLTVARYCRANYYNQSSGDESGQLSNSSFVMFANSDGFLRKTSLAQLGNKMPLYDGNVSWGGANVMADYRPADAAFCDALSGNRFAGINGSAVTVEYSRDAGSTWTAYPDSVTARKQLFTTKNGYNIGAADESHKATATNNYRLRVTVDTGAGNVYSTINKFIIQISTSGSNNCRVTIQKALQSSPTSFSNVVENVPLGGWSGYNVVNLGASAFTTYGNQTTTQYGRVRFIFAADAGNTNYTGMQVLSIYGYGGFGWNTPSTLAKTGHVYSYDEAMNVTFPASLSAASINASTLTGAYIVNDYSDQSGTKGKPLFNYRYRDGTLKGIKLPAVSGAVTINPNTVTSVSFGTTFNVTPHVIAQYATTGGNAGGDWGSIKISSVTTTGFNAVIGGSSPSSAVIEWFAIMSTNG